MQQTKFKSKANWFEDWFDTDYYHLLYGERNLEEAKLFLDKLQDVLRLQSHHNILDLACGRGRHASHLTAKGFNVTGLDLSASSIEYAKQLTTKNARFFVHDMRQPFGDCEYDFVLNLFTSFGYFENENENLQVMQNIANALQLGGKVVIEFLNPQVVIDTLVEEEIKVIDDITFTINREVKDGFVYKHIQFLHEGNKQVFTEKVMLITLQQFQKYFKTYGLSLQHVFGNYDLAPYFIKESKRMILIAEKI